MDGMHLSGAGQQAVLRLVVAGIDAAYPQLKCAALLMIAHNFSHLLCLWHAQAEQCLLASSCQQADAVCS